MFIRCIYLSIVVEVITEVLVAATILEGIRKWVLSHSMFFGKLISCGYCTSFWVAGFLTAALQVPGIFGSNTFHIEVTHCLGVDLVLQIFVLAGLANYIHRIFSALKYYVIRIREFI